MIVIKLWKFEEVWVFKYKIIIIVIIKVVVSRFGKGFFLGMF